jgi:hypothetical protein
LKPGQVLKRRREDIRGLREWIATIEKRAGDG